jgi:hypothetical protein
MTWMSKHIIDAVAVVAIDCVAIDAIDAVYICKDSE